MAPHSSTLARQIPWTEEPGRLQSMVSLGVGNDWATSFHFSLSCLGEGNGNPLQCSCLENPRDGGAWWAAFSGVVQSWTRLKRLSSSSSRIILSYEAQTKLPLWELSQPGLWRARQSLVTPQLSLPIAWIQSIWLLLSKCSLPSASFLPIHPKE